MIGRRDGERMMISGKPGIRDGAFATHRERCNHGRARHGRIRRSAFDSASGRVGDFQPIRVVVDTEAKISLDTNLVETAKETPFWLLVGEEADADRVKALEDAGVVVERVPDGSGGLDLDAAFAKLAEGGLTRVLVEGGARLAAGLVTRDLIDEVLFFFVRRWWSVPTASAPSQGRRCRQSSAGPRYR